MTVSYRFWNPPFSLLDYPMQPVWAPSGDGWAQQVLGAAGWTLDPRSGGVFNGAEQSVSSVQEQMHLQTVMVQGQTQELSTVSFVCVGGPGAGTVDVAVYPEPVGGNVQYLGWNGSSFVPGPAINVDGYYWYRLAVAWRKPFSDPSAVFYAKTYRAGPVAQPFMLWAFTGLHVHTPG
jgi:hypothetical protein